MCREDLVCEKICIRFKKCIFGPMQYALLLDIHFSDTSMEM